MVLANSQETSSAKPSPEVAVRKSGSGIVVKGIHDLAVRFSMCCAPVPGDDIVGFVTRGRGISIHRTDCYNIISLPESERVRLIPAEWQTSEAASSLIFRRSLRSGTSISFRSTPGPAGRESRPSSFPLMSAAWMSCVRWRRRSARSKALWRSRGAPADPGVQKK